MSGYITLHQYAINNVMDDAYLRRLIRNGRLDAVKMGGTWLIREDEPLPERRKYVKSSKANKLFK